MRSINLFEESSMKRPARFVRVVVATAVCVATGSVLAQGLSMVTDMRAPSNSPRLMPNAPRGSEYPAHGNIQAGEMNLNPTDPRAQLVNGLPNNPQGGAYGSPLAGVRTYVQPGMQ
jgi:hypothetical protein